MAVIENIRGLAATLLTGGPLPGRRLDEETTNPEYAQWKTVQVSGEEARRLAAKGARLVPNAPVNMVSQAAPKTEVA